jgi:hypothetical protein
MIRKRLAFAGQEVERFRAVVRGHDIVAVERQRAGDEHAQGFFVLGDQDAGHRGLI